MYDSRLLLYTGRLRFMRESRCDLLVNLGSSSGPSEAVIRLLLSNSYTEKEGVMKKMLAVGLIVLVGVFMLSAPHTFAQSELSHIEPEGLFSLSNTLWQLDGSDEISIGFYNGSVFACISSTICAPTDGSFYFDFIFISYFRMDIPDYSIYGLLFPLFDNGQVIVEDTLNNEKEKFPINKIEDPWTPDSFLLFIN